MLSLSANKILRLLIGLMLMTITSIYAEVQAESLNSQSDAKFTLTADGSRGNKVNNLTEYYGNVHYLSPQFELNADKLSVKAPENKGRTLVAEGSPATLTQLSNLQHMKLLAQEIRFNEQENSLRVKNIDGLNATINQSANILLIADSMEYRFSAQPKVEPLFLTASGQPLSFQITTINSSDENAKEVKKLTAKELNINYQSGVAILEGDVTLRQAGELIRAEKIIFDLNDQTWEIPASTNQRIEVIKKPNS